MDSQRATEQGSTVKTSPKRKILVVDDDPVLLQAMHLRLRANQYDIVSACDGYSAVALAQKEKPDLILLDLGLPAGDGFTVLKRLKQFPALAPIPVIVLSARDPHGNETRSLQAGAVAFFQKPADNDELLGAMRTCLEAGRPFGWHLSS